TAGVAGRRGDAAVLLAQSLDVDASLALVRRPWPGGGEPAFRRTPLGEHDDRVAPGGRVADRLVDRGLTVLDVGMDLLGQLDLLAAGKEQRARQVLDLARQADELGLVGWQLA